MYSCVLGFMFSSRFQLLQVVNVVIPFNQGRGTAREGSAGGGEKGEGCPPASSQTSSANVSLVFFSPFFYFYPLLELIEVRSMRLKVALRALTNGKCTCNSGREL